MNSTLAGLGDEEEPLCPLSETYTFLRFFIICIATAMSVLGTAANGLLIYIFCTKKPQAGTPATLYPTALAFLDFGICLEYILLFGVDAIVTFAQVKSLFILYYIYIIPVYVLARITQLAIPYMLIFATLERLVWTYGTIRSPALRVIYSKSGRIWTMASCLMACVVLRIPSAFSIEVAEYPLCQDFFRTKITAPRQWAQESGAYFVFDWYLMTIAQTFVPFLILVFLNMVIVRKMGSQDSKPEDILRPSTPSPSPSRILLSDDTSPKTTLGIQLQSLKGMSPSVRSAVYTMTAIVASYLISNTLHLILTILERYESSLLVDANDNTLSSPFHTYFSDMVSFVYMFTSAIRLFIYYICNPGMRKDIKNVIQSEQESEVYL